MKLRTHAGLTLLELLITITLIMIMVGFASFNYVKIVEEQKVGKAQNECREFVKALKAWENKKGVPVRQYVSEEGRPQMACTGCKRLNDTAKKCRYCPTVLPVRTFLLDDLQRENIVKTLPEDPWSVQYELDTTKGIVFSRGPDREANTGDDIAVQFRPVFEVLRAYQDVPANQVVVEFSRALDRFAVTTSTIKITSAGPVDVTTLAVDLSDPYRVKGKLKAVYPKTDFTVEVTDGLRARDGSVLNIDRNRLLSTSGAPPTT